MGCSRPNSKLREVRCSSETGRRTRKPETEGLLETGPRSDGRSGSSVCSAIDIEKCEKCGGPVRIIASIEDPDVIPDASDRSDPEAPGAGSGGDPLIRSPPQA